VSKKRSDADGLWVIVGLAALLMWARLGQLRSSLDLDSSGPSLCQPIAGRAASTGSCLASFGTPLSRFWIDTSHDSREVADWAGTSERMIEMIYRHRLTRATRLLAVVLPGLDE
jgi:hypothetical protein